ncbi:Thiosulfate sulfurtransferase [Geodia barretti]|uniref:Thiosulfate sulfurtransferase n=1 Tax=Geodia barretti TaxID=519541 RepID=A0AA35RTE6_GEOBA|nr:Thiosulfate sulfurtransferase [Geodia barretti]
MVSLVSATWLRQQVVSGLKNIRILDEFQRSGVDLTQPVVATCGSGVTAALIALAAHSLNTTTPLYDGSWSEWRQRAPLQTVTTGVTQLPHNTPS